MPEHDARVRAFYDHEAEEPRTGRRRRAVADWGVGEDIFDRMPSRRFTRAERRAAHGTVVISRDAVGPGEVRAGRRGPGGGAVERAGTAVRARRARARAAPRARRRIVAGRRARV